jgi:hypothetical protein
VPVMILWQKLEAHGRQLGSEEINQFETIAIEGRK